MPGVDRSTVSGSIRGILFDKDGTLFDFASTWEPAYREAVAALSERGVFCDCRPGVGLRLSPHFFNTDDEIDAALRIIDEMKIASPAG